MRTIDTRRDAQHVDGAQRVRHRCPHCIARRRADAAPRGEMRDANINPAVAVARARHGVANDALERF